MSVLQCDRKSCPNIMCLRLSDEHGYICDDCFEELVALGWAVNLDTFMQTPKRLHPDRDHDASRAYYSEIFKREDD